MMNVMDQTTTIQGGLNSSPWLNSLRSNVPIVGPLGGLLTITPLNLASQFIRDVRRATHIGTSELRAPALRRLATQFTFGTLIAGPFWIAPILRDIDNEDDKNRVLAFASAWDKKFNLGAFLNTEFASRLNPITGVVERFLPSDNALASLALGPLGRPAGDIGGAIIGDQGAQAKSLGALASLADIQPTTIIPSSLQYLLPAGIAGEKMLKMFAALAPDPTGKQPLLGLDIAVPNMEGNYVDAAGRPYVGGGGTGRAYALGGRALDEALIAVEGRKAERRVDRRGRVEQNIRRLLLDGNVDGAVRQITSNADLDLEISPTELEREALNRTLLPQARAVYSGPENDSLKRWIEAARRLNEGGMTPVEAKNERHIFLAGMLRFGS
jgi:hypothetical protein